MKEHPPKFFVRVTELCENDEPDRERRMVYNRFDVVHPVFVMNQEMRRWKRRHDVMLGKILKFLNENHADDN